MRRLRRRGHQRCLLLLQLRQDGEGQRRLPQDHQPGKLKVCLSFLCYIERLLLTMRTCCLEPIYSIRYSSSLMSSSYELTNAVTEEEFPQSVTTCHSTQTATLSSIFSSRIVEAARELFSQEDTYGELILAPISTKRTLTRGARPASPVFELEIRLFGRTENLRHQRTVIRRAQAVLSNPSLSPSTTAARNI